MQAQLRSGQTLAGTEWSGCHSSLGIFPGQIPGLERESVLPTPVLRGLQRPPQELLILHLGSQWVRSRIPAGRSPTCQLTPHSLPGP